MLMGSIVLITSRIMGFPVTIFAISAFSSGLNSSGVFFIIINEQLWMICQQHVQSRARGLKYPQQVIALIKCGLIKYCRHYIIFKINITIRFTHMNDHQFDEPLNITNHAELIEKKFSEILSKRSIPQREEQDRKLKLTQGELEKIKKDFEAISSTDKMDFELFRSSLGLFGSQDFFIRRLFNLLDEDGDGTVTVDNYYRYLNVLFYEDQFQRANFGWKLITGSRSYIQSKDFHQLFYEIASMWNAITGQVVSPKREYVEQIFSLFDLDQDETITLDDYQIFFSEQYLIFGWFEFLNGFPLEESLLKLGFKHNRAKLELKKKRVNDSYRNSTREEEAVKRVHKQELLRKKFKDLCYQMSNASKIAREEPKQKSEESPFLDLSMKTDHSFLCKFNEPVVLLRAETRQDREDTAEYIDLFPDSKRYLMKARVDLPDKDTTGKIMNELKLCLDKVNILQEVCRELKNKEDHERNALKKKKGLEVKLEVVKKANEENQAGEAEEKRKKNLAVYFGHPNWNLVLNLMVGMRQSIKTLHDLGSEIRLKNLHFSEQQSFVLSSKVQQFRSGESYYKFQAYAPLVFQKLRQAVGITNRSYQLSVGPEILIGKLAMGNLTAISEKFSTGKSGSFFYETHDGKYLLKTISKGQYQLFLKILKSYYEHTISNPHTLIVRMFGLYKLKQFRNKTKVETIRFIAMENVFYGGLKQIAVYDLKGSSYDRRGSQHEFKDNDWKDHQQKIELPKEEREILHNQIKKDSEFLRSNNINDYSMLCGICEAPKSREQSRAFPLNNSIFRRTGGGCENMKGDKVYIMSIIDCLTQFGFKKQMEFFSKRVFLGEGVSCIPPNEYSQRFINFISDSISKN